METNSELIDFTAGVIAGICIGIICVIVLWKINNQ